MDRRTFSLNAASLAGALALAGTGLPLRARAQGAPVEGRDYTQLAKPIAMARTGKIEVAEFFWYGCPHCFAFISRVEPWIAGLTPDVHCSRIPVGFDALKQIHQRVFYTWEAMGLADSMHVKTFTRFQVQRKPIDTERDMLDFARENGLDVDRVQQTWRSFSVNAKCTQATQLADAYGIDRTPEMAVQGRFTATSETRGPAGMLATTDWLIDRIRKGA